MTQKFKMGWLPDYPDIHDYTSRHRIIKPMMAKAGICGYSQEDTHPKAVDLRGWCPPVEDQEKLGSCTAQAGVGLVEIYEKKAFGNYIDASRLFLYKVTRNLMHLTGDTGAYCRATMGAMILFGIPPEEYHPYTDKKPDFDREPSAFCYAFGQSYQSIRYFRVDARDATTVDHLKQVKMFLENGLPMMFGFTVYSSIRNVGRDGKIPYPRDEKAIGGHAVVAVGYDDSISIAKPSGEATIGALLVRNSWGKEWGDDGYGWLPYKYVLSSLARDFWALIKNEWVETKNFMM